MLDATKLCEAMGELEEDEIIEILEGVMAEGGAQASEAMEACQKGMDEVGNRFETGEYFVGDLIYAGQLMTQAVEILKPALVSGESGSAAKEKVVLCTVEGDLHDIGKNIVKAMMEAAGFEIIDLGIDVKPRVIIDAVKESGAKIVALSGVLTLALDSMKKTVDVFKEAGLREQVKFIVGGAPVNKDSGPDTGADAWASNPQQTVQICRGWV
ncbi:MAG: cobalamin-binding protein [Lachnospiraceae bacterium]|nr:cobalamin-binding protein [Lachnospiraceae bacterium]